LELMILLKVNLLWYNLRGMYEETNS